VKDVHGCPTICIHLCSCRSCFAANMTMQLSGDQDTRSATPSTTRAAAAAEQGRQGGMRHVVFVVSLFIGFIVQYFLIFFKYTFNFIHRYLLFAVCVACYSVTLCYYLFSLVSFLLRVMYILVTSESRKEAVAEVRHAVKKLQQAAQDDHGSAARVWTGL